MEVKKIGIGIPPFYDSSIFLRVFHQSFQTGIHIRTLSGYAPAGADDKIDNYLTIYSLQNNDVILDMISEFQSNYPDTPPFSSEYFTKASKLEYISELCPDVAKTGTLKPDLLLLNMQGGYELSYRPSIVKYRKGEIVGNNGIFFPTQRFTFYNLPDTCIYGERRMYFFCNLNHLCRLFLSKIRNRDFSILTSRIYKMRKIRFRIFI